MTLKFRNLTIGPDDPVDVWGVEGMLAALDRGGLADWTRIRRTIERDPHGAASLDLEQALDLAEDSGAVTLMRMHLDRARWSEAEQVADRIRRFVRESGLSNAVFAERIGTSASRLSTYTRGSVTPSAVMFERMRKVSAKSFV